ncbi:aminotransferase class IV [Arthrospiribacter ruber]|uniref:Aminodeoxychorismate lyase n=1 Tax=Arthrospiribacter ruber TaxID=2487934 RepID=A0A951MAG5_9BACT|nr:aminotransferase class IV [Arthrospiribacter ruber]MBW3466332.1 aminodeoxychorismate lyase [Arthrospiribacter ruber]
MNFNMSENDTYFTYKNPGKFWEEKEPTFHNRAFLFGDGLFETMVLRDGFIRFGNFHQERILKGCETLFLDKQDLSDIKQIQVFLRENGFESGTWRVRWNVYRSGFGKYTPENDSISATLMVSEFVPAVPVKRNLAYCSSVRLMHSRWSSCKTLNALPYVMANIERKQKGLDDVILLSQEGFISEGASSNIFWEKDGVFYTPSLKSACVEGVSRRVIIEKLEKMEIEVREGLYLPQELLQADRVFTSNVTGLSLVEKIEGSTLDINALPPELTKEFEI